LALALASPRTPEAAPVVVSVLVNGRAIGTATVRRELGWNEIVLPLPADLNRASPLTVELRTTTVRLPGDRRTLGVAVASVALESGVRSTNDERRIERDVGRDTRYATAWTMSHLVERTSYFRLRTWGRGWIGRTC
jgi:hypothetical protein